MERIIDCFRAKEGIKLLDYSHDSDHNRMVVTAIGTPEAMEETMVEAIGAAVREIDLTKSGTTSTHGRCGCCTVYSCQEYDNGRSH